MFAVAADCPVNVPYDTCYGKTVYILDTTVDLHNYTIDQVWILKVLKLLLF